MNYRWIASPASDRDVYTVCIYIVKVVQSCLTLCDPMDYTVHGILQARILEWVAFPFPRIYLYIYLYFFFLTLTAQ